MSKLHLLLTHRLQIFMTVSRSLGNHAYLCQDAEDGSELEVDEGENSFDEDLEPDEDGSQEEPKDDAVNGVEHAVGAQTVEPRHQLPAVSSGFAALLDASTMQAQLPITAIGTGVYPADAVVSHHEYMVTGEDDDDSLADVPVPGSGYYSLNHSYGLFQLSFTSRPIRGNVGVASR
jgi:hypothetical protein